MKNKQERLDLLERITVKKHTTMLKCLKIMDLFGKKLLIVKEKEKFFSLLSIGDIQRAIIDNISLNSPIHTILRSKVDIANSNESFEAIKSKMLKFRVEYMPVISKNLEIEDVFFWEDVFKEDDDDSIYSEKINIPVVIMAGGKGTRLKPLTNVIPKPLIPIGEKPIIEHIINNFYRIGCKKFYATLNYKADMISYYFSTIKKDYTIKFALEKTFLGTAGSIHMLKEEIKETFFVSNCDILIDEDFREIYYTHKNKQNDITIVVAIKNFSIPYGTIELNTEGLFKNIKEKPELSYMINTGMYILEPKTIGEIQSNEFLHITTLIEKCHKKGMKIGIFPISEASWMDMGQWKEYHQTLEDFEKRFRK